MIEPPVIGALPRDKIKEVRFKIRGYNIVEGIGVKVSDHSEIITLREIPDILTHVELWYEEFLIATVPLAMGGGYWHWVPPLHSITSEETEKE